MAAYSQRVLTPISTILSPSERSPVDAAGQGLYAAIHRESVDDVISDLKYKRSVAVLVSVASCCDRDMPRVAALVREFPQVPAVALLTHVDASAPQRVLALGRSGVRKLVDVRTSGGWRELRSILLADQADNAYRMVAPSLAEDLTLISPDARAFIEGLFRVSPRVDTVRALAESLGVLPNTLMSRFFRAQLPPPKRYLATARLVRAARLFENSGLSIANVANHLDYSSPQSLGRHIRALLDISALEFRRQYPAARMLERFRNDLLIPYADVLQTFSPLSLPPGWAPMRHRTAVSANREARTP